MRELYYPPSVGRPRHTPECERKNLRTFAPHRCRCPEERRVFIEAWDELHEEVPPVKL